KAHASMQRDTDYVIEEGEVVIVDQFTGRLMKGRRYSDGLHQAIEAKEKLQIQNESMTLASITFQNFFRMYNKLAGMTGTAITHEDEFRNIDSMDVVANATTRPIAGEDRDDLIYKPNRHGLLERLVEDRVDLIYKTTKEKYDAVVEEIKQRNDLGQP